MKKPIVLLGFLFSLLLFSQAKANTPTVFDGVWDGKGTYIFNGEMRQCSEMHMVFSADVSTFSFVTGKRICDNHDEIFYPVVMDYRDGKLFFNGEIVGTYDGNRLTATYRMPDGDTFRIWRMSMHREGNHLMYEESRTMEGETTPLISFAGMLIMQ